MCTTNFQFNTRVIKARTGSGKSTDLTWQIYQEQGPLLSIQPRVQNATGISSWMNQTGRLAGCITGARKSPTNQLDYCTTGCAFKLLKEGNYNTVVFDEIQDATAQTFNLLRIASQYVPNIVIMSATIPQWCYNLGCKIESLEIQPREFYVQSKFGILLDQILSGSDEVPFRNSLENVLEVGNALIFINGLSDLATIEEDYGYEISCILDQTNSKQMVIFRGTDDSSKMLKQIREGQFPKRGILLISNISLGTGVTIPNLKLIWDKGVVLRTHSHFTETNYRVDKWLDGLTTQEAYQRSSRGGRTCNSNYYCGLNKNKLREEVLFPLDYREMDVCEIASYLNYEDRIEYFQMLRDLNLISQDNDLEYRLELKLGGVTVPKIFDGYDLYTNIKSPKKSLEWNYNRMINTIVIESKHYYNFNQIDSMIKYGQDLSEFEYTDYCPIQNRVYMLMGQVRNYLH